MNLQNDYKVIYEVVETNKKDKVRVFKASKTGVFKDAEVIGEAKIGEYKLIYEKDGQIFGSKTGIPAKGDFVFADFDKVFKKASETPTTPEEPGQTPDGPTVDIGGGIEGTFPETDEIETTPVTPETDADQNQAETGTDSTVNGDTADFTTEPETISDTTKVEKKTNSKSNKSSK